MSGYHDSRPRTFLWSLTETAHGLNLTWANNPCGSLTHFQRTCLHLNDHRVDRTTPHSISSGSSRCLRAVTLVGGSNHLCVVDRTSWHIARELPRLAGITAACVMSSGCQTQGPSVSPQSLYTDFMCLRIFANPCLLLNPRHVWGTLIPLSLRFGCINNNLKYLIVLIKSLSWLIANLIV